MQISTKAAAVKESSTLAITAKAKEMKASGISVIGFGAGEPDFPTPENICRAAVAAIEKGYTKYTASTGILELRKAICAKLLRENGLSYEPSQIVVSNGAKHSLTNIFTALLNPGDEVIIPAPFWLSYTEMVSLASGVPVIVTATPETGLKATVPMLEAALTAQTKAIIINSPNNPTGMVYRREELQAIADFAVKHDLFVISDEIYETLIYDDDVEHISIASLGADIFARTIIVNGFSKSHAMTGWRIGYTASSKELARVMGNVQSHCTSNPNSIAQYAALEAYTGDQSCLAKMQAAFKERRNYIYDRVVAIPGLHMLKPEGAFYAFVDVSALYGKHIGGREVDCARDIAAALLEQACVAVVPCADFGFPHYIRLSYAVSLDEIKEGLDRIEAFVKSL